MSRKRPPVLAGYGVGKAASLRPIEANESVGFPYDGYNYALDLCPPHAEKFHATVQTPRCGQDYAWVAIAFPGRGEWHCGEEPAPFRRDRSGNDLSLGVAGPAIGAGAPDVGSGVMGQASREKREKREERDDVIVRRHCAPEPARPGAVSSAGEEMAGSPP